MSYDNEVDVVCCVIIGVVLSAFISVMICVGSFLAWRPYVSKWEEKEVLYQKRTISIPVEIEWNERKYKCTLMEKE